MEFVVMDIIIFVQNKSLFSFLHNLIVYKIISSTILIVSNKSLYDERLVNAG
jgi:hypothetical protein